MQVKLKIPAEIKYNLIKKVIIFHVEILDCQVSAEIFVTHGCCHILHASRIDLAKRNDYIKKETAKIVPECGSDTTDSRFACAHTHTLER